MPPPVPTPSELSAKGGPHRHPVTRITPDLAFAAACRLVSQSNANIEHAARRLVASSSSHGIDLSLVWGTVEYRTTKPNVFVRQACLAVLGAGKTAMMFVSEPPRSGDPGGTSKGIEERSDCVRAACEFLAGRVSAPVRIAQALPDHKESWAVESFRIAGFLKVGDLMYMKRVGVEPHNPHPSNSWPKGVEITAFAELAHQSEHAAHAAVVNALDRSYEGTLDCPELCGLRDTADVAQSHRATGEFDPTLWWIVKLDGIPHGCLLLNPCRELRSVELVYLGLSPALRGSGLARGLLSWGLSRAAKGRSNWDVTCAVDSRNTPALKLYRGLGFREGARRVALVKVLGNPKA